MTVPKETAMGEEEPIGWRRRLARRLRRRDRTGEGRREGRRARMIWPICRHHWHEVSEFEVKMSAVCLGDTRRVWWCCKCRREWSGDVPMLGVIGEAGSRRYVHAAPPAREGA